LKPSKACVASAQNAFSAASARAAAALIPGAAARNIPSTSSTNGNQTMTMPGVATRMTNAAPRRAVAEITALTAVTPAFAIVVVSRAMAPRTRSAPICSSAAKFGVANLAGQPDRQAPDGSFGDGQAERGRSLQRCPEQGEYDDEQDDTVGVRLNAKTQMLGGESDLVRQ
jgi:hypothetical protein